MLPNASPSPLPGTPPEGGPSFSPLHWLVPNATVFVANACIMIVELVAGRIISRHLGQSLYTWTSVIGVVLAGIAIGNYGGGYLADRYRPPRMLSLLFVLSALCCVSVPGMNHLAGQWSWLWECSWPTRILGHVIITFILPSALLGAISPVVAKMALEGQIHTGRTIGGIYASGTVGSIFGTFLAGFYLISRMGTTHITLAVGCVLAIMGVLYGIRARLPYLGLVVTALAWIAAVAPYPAVASIAEVLSLRPEADPHVVYEDETQYSHVTVRSDPETPSLRRMFLDRLLHSALDIRNPLGLKYEYTWIYESVLNRSSPPPSPVSSLLLGGGGYAFPQYLEVSRPGSRIEVTEIDPGVTKAAVAACGLKPDSSILTHNLDARNYVATLIRRKESGQPVVPFDYVFGDAFSDHSVPYQLVTEEFNRMLFDLLAPDGMYLLNLIDSPESGSFLGAVVRTCSRVFPHVTVFTCHNRYISRDTFVVVCSKPPVNAPDIIADIRKAHPSFRGTQLTAEDVRTLLARSNAPILTDNYAPVENLLAEVIRLDRKDMLREYINSAIRAAKRGDTETAERTFRRCLDLDPNNADTYYNLGVFYAESEKPGEALDMLAAAVQLDPDLAPPRNLAAVILAKTGHMDAAIAQWAHLLNGGNKTVDILSNLGNAFALKGEPDRAVPYLQEALELNPDHISTHVNLGNVLDDQGKREEAIHHYREALRLNPNLAEAHNNIGTILADIGEIQQAVAEFTEALRISPDLAVARQNLTQWQARLEQAEQQKSR